MSPVPISGSEIYKDGEPVSEKLSTGETVTVPDGEIWVVTISGTFDGGSNAANINGNLILRLGTNTGHTTNESINVVLTDGDEVDCANLDALIISGWSI